jgi:hypothetical protein
LKNISVFGSISYFIILLKLITEQLSLIFPSNYLWVPDFIGAAFFRAPIFLTRCALIDITTGLGLTLLPASSPPLAPFAIALISLVTLIWFTLLPLLLVLLVVHG